MLSLAKAPTMYEFRACLAHLAVLCGTTYSFVYERYSFAGALCVSVDAIFPSYKAYSLGSDSDEFCFSGEVR